MTVAPFLRAVPMLAEVAPELLDRLADGARAVSIEVLRRGDAMVST